MVVFVNLQQENVYLLDTFEANSRNESSCEKKLANGLHLKGTLFRSVLFFILMVFLSKIQTAEIFLLFLMLKIVNQ